MKPSLILLLLLSVTGLATFAQTPGQQPDTKQILLPNGWKLSPAGHSIQLGDLPLNIQLSSSGKYLAATNNGQSVQSIQLIDPATAAILDSCVVGKAWYGLTFTKDEKHLYVSGANDNLILNFPVKAGKLGKADTIILGKPWPKQKISPAGIAVNNKNTKCSFLFKRIVK